MRHPTRKQMAAMMALMSRATKKQLRDLQLHIYEVEAERWRDDDSPEAECGFGVCSSMFHAYTGPLELTD